MNNNDKDILFEFKELKTDRASLFRYFGKNPVYAETDNPICITCNDLIKLIEFYVSKKINYEKVIEWCDVVRFSDDLFDYPDEEEAQDVIATVIDEIQDTEETTKSLSDTQIKRWLSLLKALSNSN